ncbi:hypothetical protein PQX77_007595 [Marasmius sp. AFHP31]|nr:hypothetical protein PQX77_007595 [Marasmius sp. AFHP31]
MSNHEELPYELQVEAFAYGENGKRVEVKLHPRVPEDRLGKPPQIGEWGLDFAKTLLHDVKHAEKWKCEFCGDHAKLPRVQAGFWTHLNPPRLVLYVHETCDKPNCAIQFDYIHAQLSAQPGTLSIIEVENTNILPPVSGSCIKCAADSLGEMNSAPLQRSHRLEAASTPTDASTRNEKTNNIGNTSDDNGKRKHPEDFAALPEEDADYLLNTKKAKRTKNATASDVFDVEPEVENGEKGALGRLPVELLREMFLCCPSGTSSFKASGMPWTLGRVCRRWRQVASSTRELWTTISFQDSDLNAVFRNRQRAHKHYEMLHLMLARRAEKKLHIKVELDRLPPIEMRRFFDLLRSTTRDWVSLTLDGYPYTHEGSGGVPLYPQPEDRKGFASLEAVSIQDMSTWECQGKLRESLEKAPKLCSITIHHFNKTRNIVPFPLFRWPKLVHFELDRSPYNYAWSARGLALCSSLESLVIYASSDRGTDSFMSMTEFSTVRKLRLVSGAYKGFSRLATYLDFCRGLKLPGLEQLEVDSQPEADSQAGVKTDWENITALLERSAPAKLKSVSIGGISLMDVTVGRLLRNTPQVTSLTITGNVLPYLPNAILSGDILPNLEYLGIARLTHWRGLSRPTIAAIVNLLKSGNPTGTLGSVRVTEENLRMTMECRPREYDSARPCLESTLLDHAAAEAFEDLLYDLVYWDGLSYEKVLNENIQLVEFILKAVEESEPGTCKFWLFCSKKEHRNIGDLGRSFRDGDLKDRWDSIRERMLRIAQERWQY